MSTMYEDVTRSARLLLTHQPEPVYIEDVEGRVLWGNPAYERLAQPGKARAAYGERVPVRSEDGRTIAYTVYSRAASEDRAAVWHRIVAEHTSDTIVLVDRDAVVRYVSPSFASFTGYRLEQYEGIGAFDVIHKEDREQVNDVFRNVLASKAEAQTEYRVVRVDGHTIHAEARVKPVLDGDGEVQYVVAVVRDMTERKEAERLLENILENVGAGIWSTDRDFTRHTFMSKSMEKLSGLPREEVMPRPMRMHDHIHPDDNERMMRELKPKLDKGIPIDIPIRFIHVEGETRWARMIVQPVLDRHGETTRLDSIVVDITEQKRSELALEESRQRYKSLFENNLDGVFSIELSGYFIVNANPAFEAITGVEKARLAGRCFLGVVGDEDHGDVHESLLRVQREGRPRDLECRLAPTKDGRQRIVHITFVPIFLEQALTGIHGIVKDITKRKEEERELIDSERRYKALQQSLNRFSNDLANVMKVSDLERRLLNEVRDVLQAEDAAIEEVPKGEEPRLPTADVRIRIGEKRHPAYLRLGLPRKLLPIEREWLETVVRHVTILYDNLHLIEDLMKRMEELVSKNETPRWMLRLLFKLSEKERATLSSDLHDAVLQDLIIWYRKLESLRSQRRFDPDAAEALMRIEEGLLDAIHQIRITCNELRPPFLLKMGLVESLKSLFEYTRMFANYEIEFSAEATAESLNEEQLLGVYRIVQELLNNANKHSKATKVAIALRDEEDGLAFAYSDDGVGMEWSAYEDSFRHMGLAGIEKRVLSLEGRAAFRSAPGQGFHVEIRFPKL